MHTLKIITGSLLKTMRVVSIFIVFTTTKLKDVTYRKCRF